MTKAHGSEGRKSEGGRSVDVESLILVSVDDHCVEPPDMFEGRLPAKYADLAPKLITREDGTNAWLYNG